MTVVESTLDRKTVGRTRIFRLPAQPFTILSRTLAVWRRRIAYRNDLKRLLRVGPHMIADVGLTIEETHQEIEKPFWRS